MEKCVMNVEAVSPEKISEVSKKLQQAIFDVGELAQQGCIQGVAWDEANRRQDQALAEFNQQLALLDRGVRTAVRASLSLRGEKQ